MAVAFDAATESALFDETSVDPFTFTHTPSGTPRGVLVFAIQPTSSTDAFTGITYGGVPMTAVTGGRAVDTATEPGACKAFFLGASIPTGAQTVSIDHDTAVTTIGLWVVCITVTAAADTEISGTPVLLQEDGLLAEQNVDTGATTALRFAGAFSGLSSPTFLPAGANSTAVHDVDFGNQSGGVVRETTGGSGSRPVGFNSGANSDDRAAVHLAIAESGGAPPAAGTRSQVVIIG